MVKSDIVVIVEGGLVTHVYSLDSRANCEVIDLDPGVYAFDQEGEEERQARADKVHADKRYTEVY
jgi:hypothetical protein